MPDAVAAAAWLDLVEGRRCGPLAALARAGLATLSLPYAMAVHLRAFAYRTGLFPVHRLPVPVVSVGNLSLGGTGKTPLVALLVRRLLERGRRPAVLTRGYGRTERGDDEALLPEGALRVVDPARARGGRRAIERHGADVLVLDDGFQHRALARDLDLVLVDATRPLDGARLFPRGELREPRSALARADFVILTRVDQASAAQLEAARAAVTRIAGKPPAEAVHEPAGLRLWPAGESEPAKRLASASVFGFCGIGNPEAFRRTLQSLGANVAGFRAFPDHHAFTEADRDRVCREAAAAGAEALVTTAKDALRLSDSWRGASRPIRVLDVRLGMVRGADDLWGALERVCGAPVAAGRPGS